MTKMKKSLTMCSIALALSISGCDSDDTVENQAGEIAISGNAVSGETLTASVTDGNGIDGAISYAWSVDGSTVAGATSSTFILTNSHSGADVSVSATYTDNDDFSETVNSSTVTVANETATIAGDLTGEVAHDATVAITGTATVSDTDGEDEFTPLTDHQGTYGTFSITAAGDWTYTVDTTNTDVASLIGADLTDSIFIEAADGSPATISITIKGGNLTDNVAMISDTDDGDTGELYYKFDEGTTTGKLSLSILYGEDETETAYISLYDAEGSTSTVIGELSLNEGAFGLRKNTYKDGEEPSKAAKDTSTIDEDAIDAPNFILGEWIDVVMTWDTSSTTERGTYSITIDETTYGPFDSEFPTPGVAVESMTIRLSSNGSTSSDAIYINDLNIYSDVAGTTALLEEDFEGFTAGDSLTDENENSPFGSRTFEAVVVDYSILDSSGSGSGTGGGDLGEGDVAPGTSGNKVAFIQDELDDDAGELRYKLSSSDPTKVVKKGKLTASFMKSGAATCTVGDSVKDAYIGIYSASTSSYNALVDLRIDGSDYDTDYAIRNKNEDGNKTVDIPTSTASFTADEWTNVEMTWDATNATDEVAPLITVAIDGTQVAAAWNSYGESLADLTTGATTFTFRLGDSNANMPDCKFYVDNVKVYSDDDAADTLIWAENFENFDDGVDLDKDNNTDSPFHANTADAVVTVED